MKSKISSNLRLLVLGCLTSFLLSPIEPLQAQSAFVTRSASFGAKVGDPAREFQLLETAAKALGPGGGTIQLQGGPWEYAESLVLDTPLVLSKQPGSSGEVRIGDRSGIIASEDLNIMTFNCRLFDPLSPSAVFTTTIWDDYSRALSIGAYLSLFSPAEIDLVGLCEVWDWGGDNNENFALLSSAAGYPHTWYFDNPGVIIEQNSGLAILSRIPIENRSVEIFDDCALPDCLANKGIMMGTIQKGPFRILVIHTHAQAGNGASDIQARNEQLITLQSHALNWMSSNPDDVVILMGDLNVPAETTGSDLDSQYDYLANLVDPEGRDAIRHSPVMQYMQDARLRGDQQPTVISSDLVHEDRAVAYTFQPDLVTFGNGTQFAGNELAKAFDSTSPSQRLDYIIYYPNGKTRIVPKKVQVINVVSDVKQSQITGVPQPNLSSDELSDHNAIRVEFELQRFE